MRSNHFRCFATFPEKATKTKLLERELFRTFGRSKDPLRLLEIYYYLVDQGLGDEEIISALRGYVEYGMEDLQKEIKKK